MADPLPKYRFLPWTRRGLAATLSQPDAGGQLVARAPLPVSLSVTGVAPAGVDLELYGPGDVLGIDQRLIVRTDPRPNVTDFEPNYFATLEFDLPDFPWMFTPASAGGQERLRPWCVLVVLDQRVVELPKVNRGAPLPVITVPAEVSGTELPDLSESWAWAHTQVLSDNSELSALQQEMGREPNLNLSRLVCPRRLQPNRHYVACLVPAFDLGVQRGLGLTPTGTNVKPAWTGSSPGEVKLPLYFHWQFATGPAGDFESLARKLTPTKAPAEMGFQRMFVGAAGGGIADAPADRDDSYLKMEGVLRAPKAGNSALTDVAASLRADLQRAINAPAAMATGTNPSVGTLAPPIYGEWHLNRHSVQDAAGNPEWLRELNLDPRTRAAAGLGTEVIRAHQEDFMQAAWEQVGDVIKANELLNRARFAKDVHRRTYERHYVKLPQDRLFQLTAPLHPRTLLGDKTVRARITAASLPNASVDPALRRLASPQRPVLKSAARRGNFANTVSRSMRSALIPSLAENKVALDPTQFMPDGLIGAALLEEINPTTGSTKVDLSAFGLSVQLDSQNLTRMQATRTDLIKVKPQSIPKISLRTDLATTGVILSSQVLAVRDLQTAILAENQAHPERNVRPVNLHNALAVLSDRAQKSPDATAFLLNAEPDARTLIGSLHVDAQGNVLLRQRTNETGVAVAKLETVHVDRPGLTDLPVGALSSKPAAGTALPLITRREGTVISPVRPSQPLRPEPLRPEPLRPEPLRPGEPLRPSEPIRPSEPLRPERPSLTTGPLTVVLAGPTRESAVVSRFQQAFTTMAQAVRLDTPDALATFVAFDVKSTRDTLVARLNPEVMVPRRVRTMLGGEAGLELERIPGLTVLPQFDRIMAAPEIAAPIYSYLARYDRERFLPGIGQLPPDSITLLETNPRFIEAFMVGLNYEMNRELLWREYPTDQRGTVLRKFWSWTDGGPDLTAPIHQWLQGGLGTHVRGTGQGGQIVLLLRGQLLRRYPNTVLYAWRAKGAALKDPPTANDIREPVFRGAFDPDVSFAGFDLRDTDLTLGDGWFFVLQEQPTEPRFGLDETSAIPVTALNKWADASWTHTNVAPGGHLLIQSSALNNKTIGGVVFGRNSAHLAHITLQKPMRVAIHGKHMVG